MNRRGQIQQARPGAATVELALLLPLLCFLFVIAVDFARVFYFDLTVENCARCGALYAGADPTKALDTAGITAEAKKDAGTLDASQMTVTATPDNATTPTTVTVTVTYPFTTFTRYPGVPSSITMTRKVVATVAPAKPNLGTGSN
jgi:Flp pilus assembly protein TadG